MAMVGKVSWWWVKLMMESISLSLIIWAQLKVLNDDKDRRCTVCAQ